MSFQLSRRRIIAAFSLPAIACACIAFVTACKKEPTASTNSSNAAPAETASGTSPSRQSFWQRSAGTPTSPPPAELWKEFSGQNAFEHTRWLVELGPRPAGSDELEKARQYIATKVEQSGWKIERQEFTDQTPRGKIRFVNLIARFGSAKPTDAQQVVIASHYDTKLFDTIRFVGASDGGSSTGALIELARVLALDGNLAKSIELVFFDGEEAFAQFTKTDGLYGSRYYAHSLVESKRNQQFKFGILWDMIGDKNLTITLSPDSPPQLARGILDAASALGFRQNFSYHERDIYDDHAPLNDAHIPTIDLIDFDYPPWHTADDTLDKLSPESLQKVGAATLFYLRKQLSNK